MKPDSERLAFHPLGEEHISLLEQWLKTPHVAEFWQEPDCQDETQLREKFLGALPLRGVRPFVLFAGEVPIGYFQYYEARKVGGGWWPGAGAGTYGMDQFLGHPGFVGRGVGARALRKFVREIFSGTPATEIIADPEPGNIRAVRAYRACGFRTVGEIDTPGGKALLLKLTRSPLEAGPIRAILTDLDGVIRFFPAHRDSEIEARHGLAPAQLSRIAFRPELLNEVITGKISDETWRERIGRELKEYAPGCDAAAAVGEWSRYPGEVSFETLNLLRELCPGPLALLTNATSRLERDLRGLGILSYFDLILNSCELGVAKPAAEVFRIACERLELPASQVLFLDDSEANVAAARAEGLVALHVSGRERLREALESAAGRV